MSCANRAAGRPTIRPNPHADVRECFVCDASCGDDASWLWEVRSPACARAHASADQRHFVYCDACLRADRCLGCEHERAQHEVLVGIDNSNMIVGLQSARGFRSSCARIVDDRWRIDFTRVFEHLVHGLVPARGSVVVGSTTSQSTDAVWAAMTATVQARGWGDRVRMTAIPRQSGCMEKEVDATIVTRLKDAMHASAPVRGTLKLFTADRDFAPLVTSFVEARWKVQLVTWHGVSHSGSMLGQFRDNALVTWESVFAAPPLAYRVGYQRLSPVMHRNRQPKIAILLRDGAHFGDRTLQAALNMLSTHLSNVAGIPMVYCLYPTAALLFTSPCAEDHLRKAHACGRKGEQLIRNCETNALRYLQHVFAAEVRLHGARDVAAWESVPLSTSFFETHEQAWRRLRVSLLAPCVQLPTVPLTYVPDFMT